MNKVLLLKTCLAVTVSGMIACNNAPDSTATAKDSTSMSDTVNAAAQAPAPSPADSLFDGKSLAGWHGYNKKGEVKNWTIEDGALVCLGAAKDAHGGDLVSDKEYENFELIWDWKITKEGNSGIMYHVVEDPKYKAPYETGPEYQMIDDIGFPEKLEEWQKTGADYAMNPANDKKKVNPIGQWNSSKIIFNNGHVEHWLNGEKIVEFQAWDDKWNKEKKEGKWKDYPDYGVAKKGKIALQDHGHKAYFKNISIKTL
jgi:3-keto-disaccharide hydrolase